VDDLGARVLVLAGAGERDRQDFAVGSLSEQLDARIFHRQLGPEVAVDPLDRGIVTRDRALVTRLYTLVDQFWTVV
jgi:hypothetical protein